LTNFAPARTSATSSARQGGGRRLHRGSPPLSLLDLRQNRLVEDLLIAMRRAALHDAHVAQLLVETGCWPGWRTTRSTRRHRREPRQRRLRTEHVQSRPGARSRERRGRAPDLDSAWRICAPRSWAPDEADEITSSVGDQQAIGTRSRHRAEPRSNPTPHSAKAPEQRLGLRPVPVDRWLDYHVNSSRRAHHASAASITLSASGTLSIIQAVATQCRGIRVITAGSNRRSSGVTGSGAELS
jgi:hypothetical protein